MKVFSIEEANSLLPSVRVILSRIQRTHRHVVSYQTGAKHAAEGAEQGGGGMPEGPHYVSLLVELFASTSELETLGVQLKDHARGLIDFPSLRDGRVVLLCWQIGDGNQIEWWHDVEAGFAGRQPI